MYRAPEKGRKTLKICPPPRQIKKKTVEDLTKRQLQPRTKPIYSSSYGSRRLCVSLFSSLARPRLRLKMTGGILERYALEKVVTMVGDFVFFTDLMAPWERGVSGEREALETL